MPGSSLSIINLNGSYPSPGSTTSTDRRSPLTPIFARSTASLIGVPQFAILSLGGSFGS